jgi:hypothetical protein
MEYAVLDRRGGRAVIALVALVAALVGYYWAHKPLDPALLLALGGAALDALVAALVVSAGGGVGRWILRRIITGDRVGTQHAAPLQDEGISRAERVALEGLLGLGVLAWAALALGMAGLFNGLAFWLGLLALFALNRRAMFGWLRDLIAALRSAVRTESGWARWLMLFTAVMLGLALLNAFAPPYAFDAVNYHLVGPSRYLAAGRIVAAPDNHFLGFPQGVELLYGLAIGLAGRDTAAAPLHFAFGLLALLAVGGLAKRRAGEASAWLAVALLLSAYSIWLLFGWPYVDLAVMAFGAAALVAILEWRERAPVFQLSIPIRGDGETRWLALAGLFAGLALGVKYTSVALLLALAFYVVVTSPRRAFRNLLLLGGAAALAYIPWALKGLLLYHNPVYPFIFGGLNWDAGRSNTFSTTGSGLLGSGQWWQLPLLPVMATVFGIEKGEGYSFSGGPWLLTAPLLLLLGWRLLEAREKSLARDCLLLLAPLLAFWMAMAALSAIGEQTRLMMMAMPAAAIAGALGFAGLPRKPFDMTFIARALVGLTLVFGVVDAVRDTVKAEVVPYLTAAISRDTFLNDNLGIYINAMRQIPAGATVRLMFEPRAYYCPADAACIPDILFDHWARALRQGMTPDEVFAAWKAEGDTHILLFDLGYDFNAKDARFPENASFLTELKRHMQAIWSDGVGGYTLYTWK